MSVEAQAHFRLAHRLPSLCLCPKITTFLVILKPISGSRGARWSLRPIGRARHFLGPLRGGTNLGRLLSRGAVQPENRSLSLSATGSRYPINRAVRIQQNAAVGVITFRPVQGESPNRLCQRKTPRLEMMSLRQVSSHRVFRRFLQSSPRTVSNHRRVNLQRHGAIDIFRRCSRSRKSFQGHAGRQSRLFHKGRRRNL